MFFPFVYILAKRFLTPHQLVTVRVTISIFISLMFSGSFFVPISYDQIGLTNNPAVIMTNRQVELQLAADKARPLISTDSVNAFFKVI